MRTMCQGIGAWNPAGAFIAGLRLVQHTLGAKAALASQAVAPGAVAVRQGSPSQAILVEEDTGAVRQLSSQHPVTEVSLSTHVNLCHVIPLEGFECRWMSVPHA